jgi:hypothetical protein
MCASACVASSTVAYSANAKKRRLRNCRNPLSLRHSASSSASGMSPVRMYKTCDGRVRGTGGGKQNSSMVTP